MIFPGSMVQNLYLNPTVATSFRILYSRCQKFPYLSKYKYQQSQYAQCAQYHNIEPAWDMNVWSKIYCHFLLTTYFCISVIVLNF